MRDNVSDMKLRTVALYALSLAVAARAARASGELIEPILRKHHLPAIAWVVAGADSMLETGALGVRKLKSADLITPADRFHLGSNTKAMTATVIAMGVEEGKLSWKSRPLDVFPDLDSTIDPAYRDITLTDLLTHRASIPQFNDTDSPEFRALRRSKVISGSPAEQRRAPFLDPAR